MKPDLVKPTPIVINKFRGLYSRGIHDNVPPEYFQDCLNVNLQDINEVRTRNGITKVFDLASIVRVFTYKRLNETSRYLILDSNGNFYDSLYGSPLITNVAFVDFSVVNYNNRAYVTFHNRVFGVSSLYVYQGDGTIRLAAGSAPGSFVLSVTDSVDSGNIEAGIHLFAVAFETDSGFITKPGPAIFAEYNAPGGLKATVSNIPIGPAGTVARWILATRVLPDYDGNQLSGELFFVPNGRISDNTTTTFDVDFFDADLFVSADYLRDLRETIPGGTFVTVFNNRLVLGGIQGDAHSVYVSKNKEPETFDVEDSILTIDPSDATSGVTNAIEFRNSLIITKSNRSYITLDSDELPRNWSVDSLDKSVGTQCFGIASFLDARGTNNDRFFLADPGGLYVFESGLFKQPALSHSIEDLWKRINKNYFNKVQLALDAEQKILYVAVPLDTSTVITHLIVAYFDDSIGQYAQINPARVRWSLFEFPFEPSSILVDINSVGKAVLKFGSANGNIYEQSTTGFLDGNQVIPSFIDSWLIQQVPKYVHQFTHLHFRILGNGNADLILKGEDNDLIFTANDFLTLSSSPGREFGRKINFVNEKMAIKVGTLNNAGDYFILSSIVVSSKPKWATRRE